MNRKDCVTHGDVVVDEWGLVLWVDDVGLDLDGLPVDGRLVPGLGRVQRDVPQDRVRRLPSAITFKPISLGCNDSHL